MKRLLLGYAVLFLALLAFGIVLVRTAWVTEDAFITFRVVDNLLNGYGLRWNVIERVQAYTHPLWMLTLSGAGFFTGELFLTSMLLCMGISMAAVGMAAAGLGRNAVSGVFLIVALTSSRAFVDYSTSGLENALTHLLLVVFLLLWFQPRTGPRMLFYLSLTAGLAVLNRMDTLLLFAPALSYAWLRKPSLKGLLEVALGFAPFAAWEAFALIYYGFPFPNTAYAKLGTGIDPRELMRQGGHYLSFSLHRDAVTLLLLAAGILVPFVLRDGRMIAAALGVVLYVFYVLRIGGDYMGGRFLTPPLLVSVVLLARLPLRSRILAWSPLFAAVALMSAAQPDTPFLSGRDFGLDRSHYKEASNVGDERMYFFQQSSLLHRAPGKEMPTTGLAERGRKYRALDKPVTRVHGTVGATGYFSGPKVHLIDYYGLGDPLTARLPAGYSPEWVIGHFGRNVPEGYKESAASDINKISDKSLAQYYDHLKRITRGPLWSPERWRTIWRMNRGEYDELIDRDKYRFPNMQQTSLAAVQAGASGTPPKSTPLRLVGLQVDLGGVQHAPECTVRLQGGNRYRLLLMRDLTIACTLDVEAVARDAGDMGACLVRVPAAVAEAGYTALRVFPYRGHEPYALGSIDLAASGS